MGSAGGDGPERPNWSGGGISDIPDRRGHPLCGTPLGGTHGWRRGDARPGELLPQQHGKYAEPAGRHARGGRGADRVLLDVRHLSGSATNAYDGVSSATAGESVRRVEADGGTAACLVRTSIRPGVDSAALF